MNTLLILYLLYLCWGTVGQGRESILAMARYLRVSKTTMRNWAFDLAEQGLIDIEILYSDKGSQKLMLSLSETGEDFLMSRFSAAALVYHEHVARTIELIHEKNKTALYGPKKLTKKQREAIAAGQKELF